MDRILASVTALAGGRTPEMLVHAPFVDPRNRTPYAETAQSPYDLDACKGRFTVLYATQDKTETLGLIAHIALQSPSALAIVWPNDFGGRGLPKLMAAAGWDGFFDARDHARMAFVETPKSHPVLQTWYDASIAHIVPGTDLKAEAGLFSWRRTDPASVQLVAHLPQDLGAAVADFGCGWGFLSQAILQCPGVKSLHAVDHDARAVARIRANLDDARLQAHWANIVSGKLPGNLDAVVMNPPFHVQGREQIGLGRRFIERSAESLKRGGKLFLVANRHLPYEAVLAKEFVHWDSQDVPGGFKIVTAVKD